MYIEVGGCFKTFQFVLTSFCQFFPSVRLQVPKIVPCTVVCGEYSICNGHCFRNLPEADKHETGFSASVRAWRGDVRTDASAVTTGFLLIAWIVIEVAFIRQLSFLQPVFAGVGGVLVVIGWLGLLGPQGVSAAPRTKEAAR